MGLNYAGSNAISMLRIDRRYGSDGVWRWRTCERYQLNGATATGGTE